MTTSPTLCPHITRTIYRHDGPGTESERIWWRCRVCGIDTRSECWADFDNAAGCSDWKRDRCDHERCAAIREIRR